MDYTLVTSGEYLYINLSGELSQNTVYTVTLSAGISGYYGSGVYPLYSDYTFWFTSQYCPLFTTLTRVKLAAGPSAGSTFTDDTIYRLIHKNSIDAVEIYNTYNDLAYSSTEWGCTSDLVPAVLKRYVECKTAYDLLALLELLNTNGGIGAGGQLKTLGDLTIKYDANKTGSAATGDPTLKKQLYDCWIEMLTTIKNRGIQSAVKGWYDVSKMYSHPTFDVDHNRVIRTVDFKRSNPSGPYESSPYWRPNI